MPGFNSLIEIHEEIIIQSDIDQDDMVLLLALYRIFLIQTNQKDEFDEWILSMSLTQEIENREIET